MLWDGEHRYILPIVNLNVAQLDRLDFEMQRN